MASPESEYDLKKEMDNDSADTSKKSSRKRGKTETARRRTKTGCITCRQRRVKCDEQKPICKNCDKSRRHCAGYKPIGSRQNSQPILPPYEVYSNQGSPNGMTPTQFIYEQQHLPYCSQSFEYLHQQHHHQAQPVPPPPPIIQNQLNMYSPVNENWRYSMEGFFANQNGQWSPVQSHFHGAAMSEQPYSLDFHIGANAPSMHMSSYPHYPVLI